MDEEPAEVLGILLDPVIERLDVLLLQEPEYVLLELARPLARDNLDERRFLPHGLVHDVAERLVDVVSAVIDIVQVELELHLAVSRPPLPPRYAARRDVPAPKLLTQSRGTIGCAKYPPVFPAAFCHRRERARGRRPPDAVACRAPGRRHAPRPARGRRCLFVPAGRRAVGGQFRRAWRLGRAFPPSSGRRRYRRSALDDAFRGHRDDNAGGGAR